MRTPAQCRSRPALRGPHRPALRAARPPPAPPLPLTLDLLVDAENDAYDGRENASSADGYLCIEEGFNYQIKTDTSLL